MAFLVFLPSFLPQPVSGRKKEPISQQRAHDPLGVSLPAYGGFAALLTPAGG